MKSRLRQSRYPVVLVLLVVVMLVLGALAAGCASAPQKFAAPEQAADALLSAARAGSTDQLRRVLGSDAKDLISSGDEVADQQALARFVEAYDRKHQLVPAGDRSATLVVGDEEWPLPIPLVRGDRGGKWYFDADAGREELLNRRIGRNELDAIEVCLAIADAQREYARLDPQGAGVPLYAAKVASSPGMKDGLYWPTREGEPPSPLGELIASATAEGYTPRGAGEVGPRPYHGYMYRLLTSQSAAARGGKFDYLVNGKLIGGFGVVAFPAEYGNSGVMTFIVNHDGIVYQRDLGDDTDAIARAMTEFDPGPGWIKVRSSDDTSDAQVAGP
jgi:hypothetical protein